MNVKFTHYLITRFNVPVNNWETDKNGRPVLDHQWMENRLDLFAQYCVPTITQQTEKEFRWLLYCARHTHQSFFERIQELTTDIPQAEIVLVDHFDELLVDLRKRMATDNTPYVISSRLDNDDGLGAHYIANVQKCFSARDKLIINFTEGVLYDRSRGILTEIRNSLRNHYGSLIESMQDGKPLITVMGYPHGIPPEGSTIVDVRERYAWLKVIHDRNMASKANGIPTLRKGIPSAFNLAPETLKVSWIHTLWFVLKKSVSRLKRIITLR